MNALAAFASVLATALGFGAVVLIAVGVTMMHALRSAGLPF